MEETEGWGREAHHFHYEEIKEKAMAQSRHAQPWSQQYPALICPKEWTRDKGTAYQQLLESPCRDSWELGGGRKDTWREAALQDDGASFSSTPLPRHHLCHPAWTRRSEWVGAEQTTSQVWNLTPTSRVTLMSFKFSVPQFPLCNMRVMTECLKILK